jgi:hypothetical protein
VRKTPIVLPQIGHAPLGFCPFQNGDLSDVVGINFVSIVGGRTPKSTI